LDVDIILIKKDHLFNPTTEISTNRIIKINRNGLIKESRGMRGIKRYKMTKSQIV
jgi:hypothetical protein